MLTSTLELTWSLIGNVNRVALGRCPVIPTIVGAGSVVVDAETAFTPTRPTVSSKAVEAPSSLRVSQPNQPRAAATTFAFSMSPASLSICAACAV